MITLKTTFCLVVHSEAHHLAVVVGGLAVAGVVHRVQVVTQAAYVDTNSKKIIA
jgi:hypothetical protein